MMVQIIQMNNMVATKEFNKQNVEKTKEQAVMEVNELKKEMHNTKSKLDDLMERGKDLDRTYVKKKLEEYDNLV